MGSTSSFSSVWRNCPLASAASSSTASYSFPRIDSISTDVKLFFPLDPLVLGLQPSLTLTEPKHDPPSRSRDLHEVLGRFARTYSTAALASAVRQQRESLPWRRYVQC